MSVGAAASIASTVFSYFSPAKSPYYAVIAFGVSGASATLAIHNANFLLVFVPIAFVILVCTVLSLTDRATQPTFTDEDYNSQLRFARSVSISVSLLCLVWAGIEIRPDLATGHRWWFWLIYTSTIMQAGAFLLYIFIFHKHRANSKGKNFIQLCLIMSTFQIGCTFVSVQIGHNEGSNFEDHMIVMLFFYVMWGLCISDICRYLAHNFRLAPPVDAETGDPVPPTSAQV